MNKSQKMTTSHREERDLLQDHLRRVLEEDTRVAAAWLWGSLGKGNSDDFSDLDIWVVVYEECLPSVRADRRRFAEQIGNALLFVEAPQNGPRGGAYLMAAYDGKHGPHLADWYWQPQTQATGIPTDALVLVNRLSLPSTRQPTQIVPATLEDIAATDTFEGDSQQRRDDGCNTVSLFWAMLLISAKYITRQREEEPLFLREMLESLNRDAHRLAGMPVPVLTGIPDTSASAKIALLHQFTDTMEALMPRLQDTGFPDLPFAMPATVRRYLAMVEAVAA